MAEPASLKRLGGGRWQTRDGRFTIENQSGTWVVVDSERTNELGLPLVRGPFPSLTAAKADVEVARSEAEATSPLAERLAAAPAPASGRRQGETAARERGGSAREPGGDERERVTGSVRQPAAERAPGAEAPPREPAWLRSLDPAERSAARRLIERLSDAGVEDAEAVVRSDVVGDQPAVARVAIERRIADALAGKRGSGTAADVRAVVDVLLEGQDRSLGVRWRLVDGEGRLIRRLDVERDIRG